MWSSPFCNSNSANQFDPRAPLANTAINNYRSKRIHGSLHWGNVQLDVNYMWVQIHQFKISSLKQEESRAKKLSEKETDWLLKGFKVASSWSSHRDLKPEKISETTYLVMLSLVLVYQQQVTLLSNIISGPIASVNEIWINFSGICIPALSTVWGTQRRFCSNKDILT